MRLFVELWDRKNIKSLSSFLKRFIRRFKLLQGIEGICLTAICAVLLFAAGSAIYQLRQFLPYAPLAYSIVTGLVLLAAIGWTVFRFLGRLSQERAALYIEQKQPKLRNNLINSLQLYPQVAEAKNTPGFSATMVFALLRDDQEAGCRPQNRRIARSLAGFAPVCVCSLFSSCRCWRRCCYSIRPGSAGH